MCGAVFSAEHIHPVRKAYSATLLGEGTGEQYLDAELLAKVDIVAAGMSVNTDGHVQLYVDK